MKSIGVVAQSDSRGEIQTWYIVQSQCGGAVLKNRIFIHKSGRLLRAIVAIAAHFTHRHMAQFGRSAGAVKSGNSLGDFGIGNAHCACGADTHTIVYVIQETVIQRTGTIPIKSYASPV